MDRPTDNDTTVVESVHPLPTHMHEDGHATCELCQRCFRPLRAKGAANAASVLQYCALVTDRYAWTTRHILQSTGLRSGLFGGQRSGGMIVVVASLRSRSVACPMCKSVFVPSEDE